MFFRNLTLFRFSPAQLGEAFDTVFYDDPETIVPAEEAMAECALKPVGPMELASQGFIRPHGDGVEDATFVVRHGNAVWLTIGAETKILPTSAVNAALAKRLAEIEQREGRKPGGRTRKRLRDDIIAELLPRALVQPTRTDCYLDLQRGLLVVDTASRKRGEQVVSEIRRALGSFPALPINCEVAPRSVLTSWVLAGFVFPFGHTTGCSLADFAIFADATDGGAVVRITGQQLDGDEIAALLEAGKQVRRIRIDLSDKVQVDVDESMTLRRVRFGDGAIDALDATDRDDVQAELDARFVLMTGLLGPLFDVLERQFQWSKVEG